MRFLFVKSALAWPRGSGHDVHTYHMMRALAEAGHEVSLTTAEPPSEQAVAGLMLANRWTWGEAASRAENGQPLLRGLQERFRSYWGIEERDIRAIGKQAEQSSADAVVVVGLEVLPLLGAVRKAQRVWYAADEWVWHHLSLVRLLDRGTWAHVPSAAVKGLYEFAFRKLIDRAWVVSQADRRAMRWLAGIRHVDVAPNGVDTEHYRPHDVAADEHSCVFWGRLDFEPNIQALEWFGRRVWPRVRERQPAAELRVFGFQPTAVVQRLSQQLGIRLKANLPDLRAEIAKSQVVVLPFQSGGGIKNKLLEAASMARPIIGSRRACNGLVLPAERPLVIAGSERQWVSELLALWADQPRREALGKAARQWVIDRHSWSRAAAIAVAGLAQSQHPASAASNLQEPAASEALVG
ncbi:MAG TPA: glycosyltransferase family 4 protein [Pirellulaceae bacterium]|nr:glycosyltransferase family 4 protein [Pirellulaceae bacterium]